MWVTILKNACHSERQKVGMSKVAYHRMLVGGLEVVKCAKRWNTIGPYQKRQPFNFIREKCIELVYGMCTVQCGSMEANAPSLVLHTVGIHHQSARRVFTYVSPPTQPSNPWDRWHCQEGQQKCAPHSCLGWHKCCFGYTTHPVTVTVTTRIVKHF